MEVRFKRRGLKKYLVRHIQHDVLSKACHDMLLRFQRVYYLYAGGMHLDTSGVFLKEKSLFVENTACNAGGALSIVNPTDVEIGGASFISNKAEFGGGGAVSMTAAKDDSRGFMKCTFEGNEAVDGGALYLYTSAGEETVVESTFSGNIAGRRCPGVNIGHF